MLRLGSASFGILLALAFAGTCPHEAYAAEPYRISGTCAGFPETLLQSVRGTCVGLVASDLGTPRGVAVIGSDIYVVDTGGAGKNKGRLLLLAHSGHDKPVTLLTGLDAPTALGSGPDGQLYMVVPGRIVRLDLAANQPTLTTVVSGLPDTGHQPLTAFTFGPNGVLYVNVGSATASCEGPGNTPPDPARPCAETLSRPPRSSIIKISLKPGETIEASNATVLATGLRNSEGLAVLPDGQLAATVNVRDFIARPASGHVDEDEPHDTLDIIQPGADYGWPFCYDDKRPSPDYPGFDCAAKHAPSFLLPGHASPLAVLLYRGNAMPALSHTLLIPFHGFRKNGHRLMAMPLTPSGGLSGRLQPIIADWDLQQGVHPQGNPTALAELPDGSVLITEDHNGTLLRLAEKDVR